MTFKTNQKLHKLLGEAGLMEQKADLVYSFTNHRTGSSREMTEIEALDLVRHLRGVIDKQEQQQRRQEQQQTKQELDKTEEQKQATRRYIISVWYRIENANTVEERKAAVKVCMAWVEKHFKNTLNSFEMQDLVKIKLAAENALKDRGKAVRRAAKGEDA